MTELDLRVELRATDVREQESKVREARSALEYAYCKIKEELHRECIRLDREKANLEFAKQEAERGFQDNS